MGRARSHRGPGRSRAHAGGSARNRGAVAELAVGVAAPGPERAVPDVVALGAPGTKVTVAVFVSEPDVAVTVLASATVEARVVEKTPEALVVPEVRPSVLPVPVADRPTAAPEMGVLLASRSVRVRVVVETPSAVSEFGELTNVDAASLPPPAPGKPPAEPPPAEPPPAEPPAPPSTPFIAPPHAARPTRTALIRARDIADTLFQSAHHCAGCSLPSSIEEQETKADEAGVRSFQFSKLDDSPKERP